MDSQLGGRSGARAPHGVVAGDEREVVVRQRVVSDVQVERFLGERAVAWQRLRPLAVLPRPEHGWRVWRAIVRTRLKQNIINDMNWWFLKTCFIS